MEKTRMEELFYELYASSKQHDSWQRYAMVRELRDLMKRGSDHFERSGDEKQLPVIDDETDLLGTGTIVDPTTEICEKLVHKAILEEKSTSQFQVPIANSEIVRISEPGKVDLGLGNEESVELNENLEQEWDQKNTKKRTDVDGEVGRDQKMISDAKTCCAHKVFGKMSQCQERLGTKKKRKGFKSWMFKYRKGNKKLHALPFPKNMRVVVSQHLGMVETLRDFWLLNGKENEGCLNGSQTLIVMKGITESSSRIEELMKEEPDFVKVNEVKMEKQKQQKCSKCWMFKFRKKNIDQWLGSNLIATYLGNKKTWIMLRVAKHDNLSWKEDASDESWIRSSCCIVKLGGAAITSMNVPEKTYDENLEIVDSSKGVAESFPFLNFAAGQHLLWMKNNSEPIFIVSELGRKKKPSKSPKSWKFKFKLGFKDTNYGQLSLLVSQLWSSHRNQTGFVPIEEALFMETDADCVQQDEFELSSLQTLRTRFL